MVLSHTEHRCFAGANDGSIFVIDLSRPLESSVLIGGEDSELVSVMKSHSDAVHCLAVSGDDSKLVSGGADGKIFVSFRDGVNGRFGTAEVFRFFENIRETTLLPR